MEKTENNIDLSDIVNSLWLEKIFITFVTLIFAVSSIFYSLNLPNIYQSSAILTISESQSSKSSSASPLNALSSSFGMNMGSNNVNNAKVAESIMKSWGFAEKLISINKLEPLLGASTGWDPEEDRIIYNNERYNHIDMSWINKPTSWELYQALKSVTSVRYDESDQFIFLSANSFSPLESKNLVDIYIKSINDHMRNRQILMSNQNLEYLQEQLLKIKNNNIKQVFYNLILEENKNKMLAEANPEYMFVIVSRPMVPEKKYKPVRSIIVISISLLGLFISCLYVLLWKRKTL